MKIEKFSPHSPLKTPILFLIFKRLDTTKQVFEQIRKVKPPKLYIAADGPRQNVEGEVEKCKAVREYVLSNIDWDCKVKTLFREKNLGCGRAVSEAITWFFEQEEKGIILEDDVVPSLSFFWFCEELLERYKSDMRIWHIGGCNFQDGKVRGDGDYYFSAINHIWGWASWADRWKHYDFELKNINDDRFIENYWKGSASKYWKKIFWKMKNKEFDTWDYQWTFTMWFNKGLAILPNFNMITNIGWIDARSGITVPDKNMNKKRYEINLDELMHPKKIDRYIAADDYVMKNSFGLSLESLIKRITNKFTRLLKFKLYL